jgi:TPP-dependent pyruvate/acetoin dehydrogenase alpha subunit
VSGDGPSLFRILDETGRIVAGQKDPVLLDDTLIGLLEGMLRIRILDERMMNLQRAGRIGFYGMAKGQEATVIGSSSALEERDWIVPALREGGAALQRGYPLRWLVAQCIGNAGEPSLGRQMPCHYTDRERRFVSMSSVIGTQIAHAAGLGIAAKVRGDDVVVMGYMGDGATSSNDFHAGLNFAAVKKAPVVFVCQNNQWSISVPVSMQTAAETIAAKGAGYGMPSVRVDGNDVLAVHEVCCEAVDRAREGEGPTFVEALTYRREGHSSSDDPTRYREDAEVESWAARDPIERMRAYLTRRDLWTEEREAEFEADFRKELTAAIREAEAADLPAPETLFDDVFADLTPGLAEQRADLLSQTEEAERLDGEFPL